MRQIAFLALREVHQRDAFADVALNLSLRRSPQGSKIYPNPFQGLKLATELVYGCVRRTRTLDAVIDRLAKKPAHQQPPDLRTILHLGLYQILYLNHIPAAVAVNTTVELAKHNHLSGLAPLVNAILRRATRLGSLEKILDLRNLPEPLSGIETAQRLGILHSYPDWMVEDWLSQLGAVETEQLCQWFNKSPTIDLRINPLKTSLVEVEAALMAAGVEVVPIPHLPQGLRLTGGAGAVENLPGYAQGWWVVQDASAQLVGHLLDPQPDSVVIDACAAPGGKTTHIAELMGDTGKIWACDKTASRLKKVGENVMRLQLRSIHIFCGDSRHQPDFNNLADRVLLDAPCSGLGTLHRRPDARWRQTPERFQELSQLQGQLLTQAAGWVKPGGLLVYSTCTLHPQENEVVIQDFLSRHPNWAIEPPPPGNPAAPFAAPQGWVKIWPHRHNMDGFFMVRLRH
ncbi:16S rRNA (cytosine(967)-C(5))-methyltransferase [[Phormidium] sp. ETS-05]|uniref:16S rRNA (cytosine(967)-C(5))-methyltransferase n=1 Tax=[Phormidium] sp. ETS-05 TaxID=222819 RepID=UPI0018EED2A0|nr:16S rRNA (cytosine(967)-C(5))-methyltransferase [[Phormidium] sp. ETS-05]